jgi:hypothetical protein
MAMIPAVVVLGVPYISMTTHSHQKGNSILWPTRLYHHDHHQAADTFRQRRDPSPTNSALQSHAIVEVELE